MVDIEKVLAAMNGPGDRAKLSVTAIKAQKKAALAAALEAKKLKASKKSTAKIIPMKAKKAGKTAAPLKKAAANKKVVRKTMKTRKKR